ncbi:MAG: hypothetical protein WDW38_005267 [Sanguina aurantia]
MAHSGDLSTLLPGPRYGETEGSAFGSAGGAAVDGGGAFNRVERRDRRRAANTSTVPDGDRQEAPMQSPGRNNSSRQQGGQPREGNPTRSGHPARTDAGDADVARYGSAENASEAGDGSVPASPTTAAARSRRRHGSGSQDRAGATRPESPSPSEIAAAQGAHRASRGLRSFTRAHSGQVSDSEVAARAGGLVTEGVLAAAADAAADMHIIGEIVGGSRFQHKALFCRWQLVYNASAGSGWRVVRGAQRGSSQVSSCASRDDDMVTWEHPIDIHLKTHSLVAWPSLMFTVYSFDDLALKETLVSSGICPLPTTPGAHHLSCRTWCAYDNATVEGNRLFGWFTGIQPPQDQTFVMDTKCREDAGPFRCTVGSGQVHLRLQLLFRNMSRLRHVGGESLSSALQRLHEQAAAQRLKGRKSEDARRSAAAAKEGRPARSEGLRLVQEGREARFKSVQEALDSRRGGGGHSPTASQGGSRSRSVDPMGRPSAAREDSRTSHDSAPREETRPEPQRPGAGGDYSSSRYNNSSSPRADAHRAGSTGRVVGSRQGDGGFGSGNEAGATDRERQRDERRSPTRDFGSRRHDPQGSGSGNQRGRQQEEDPRSRGAYQQGGQQEEDSRSRGRGTDWSRGADGEQSRGQDSGRGPGVSSNTDGGTGSGNVGQDRGPGGGDRVLARGQETGQGMGPESPGSRAGTGRGFGW